MMIPKNEPPAMMVASFPCSARREMTSSSERGSCHSGAITAILKTLLASRPKTPSHRGNGPGLEQIHLVADHGPLDVLGYAVTFFELFAELAELPKFVVGEDTVGHDLLALDLPLAVEGVLVWGHLAGDDLLPDPPNRLYDHAIAAAPDGIDGEDHARLLRVHHLLHHDRHPQIFERTLLCAVEESALGEERRPTVHDAGAYLFGPFDEKVRLLLAGVASGLGVFRDGGGTHGNLLGADVFVRGRDPRPHQVFVGGDYLLPRRFGGRYKVLERSGGAGSGELQHPPGVEGVLEDVRGDHEPRRDRETVGGHAGQAGPFAAGHGHVPARFLREPDHGGIASGVL